MKIILLLACFVGVSVAESCDGVDTTKCANEICAAGFVPVCVTNICTCNPAPDPSQCSTVADCTQYWFSHHCNSQHRACDNGHCVCQHGHGNGK